MGRVPWHAGLGATPNSGLTAGATDRSGSSWRRRIGGVAVQFEGTGSLELEEALASATESRGAWQL